MLYCQNHARKELAGDATVLKSQTEPCGNGSSTRQACPCWSDTDIPHKNVSLFCTGEWTKVFFFFTPGRAVMAVWMEGCRVGVSASSFLGVV